MVNAFLTNHPLIAVFLLCIGAFLFVVAFVLALLWLTRGSVDTGIESVKGDIANIKCDIADIKRLMQPGGAKNERHRTK